MFGQMYISKIHVCHHPLYCSQVNFHITVIRVFTINMAGAPIAVFLSGQTCDLYYGLVLP